MKKSNSNKNIIIALVIAIAVVFTVMSTVTQRNNKQPINPIQSVLNDAVGFVDRAVSAPIKFVNNSVNSVQNLFNTYEENEKLKQKIDQYAALEGENQSLKNENENLKKQLDLNATLSSYDKVTAAVIDRSPDAWQDLLIINKGTKDGVQVNMAVMSEMGLIGRIIEANTASSKVELLTSSNQNSNHFPVKILTQEGETVYGLLENYDSKEEAFVITQLTKDSIKAGDSVQTSGLGGNSPANLLVGTVKEIAPDNFGMGKQAYVQPAANMYDNEVVTVVKRLVEDGE